MPHLRASLIIAMTVHRVGHPFRKALGDLLHPWHSLDRLVYWRVVAVVQQEKVASIALMDEKHESISDHLQRHHA